MIPELLRFDNLAVFVGIFITFFSLLTVIYALGFMKPKKGIMSYYLYIILTFVFSLATVFSNNLILFAVFWGILGLLLYLLIGFGQNELTPATAKKTFIIVGGTDALMLLGIALVWQITGTFQMNLLSIPLNSSRAILAYLCLALTAFAKAGAMPFHTWIPDTAQDAPIPVTAFLPASLDKLLGIYFLARISLYIFQMNFAMNTFLMIVGSFTIVAAVMMALIQHDLKRLLGYHAVSQVGYMVLGIGCGNPLGIAGGLFHMLNNAIYKSCLFFVGGAVEKKTGTTDLEKLGGLAKVMPGTFIIFLIAALAISGVPPFNGFASKWLIYQGIIETGRNSGGLWIIWLLAAMFGSALTLASFMKLMHTVFLGQGSSAKYQLPWSKEQGSTVGPMMLIPMATLALLCLLFGIFAYQIPLKLFIFPSLEGAVTFTGSWASALATVFIILGIFIGVVIYFLGNFVKTRETEAFIGGEVLAKHPQMRVSGVEFYNTISEIGFFKVIYRWARKKYFDIYNVGAKLIFSLTNILGRLHNGVLPTYLSWCLLGGVVIFYFLLR